MNVFFASLFLLMASSMTLHRAPCLDTHPGKLASVTPTSVSLSFVHSDAPVIQEAREPRSPARASKPSAWNNTLPALVGVFLGGWLAARLRERYLIARLRTGNPERLHPYVRHLSKSPRYARLLIQRWLEERRRVRDGQQDEAASRLILKELQNGLDEMERRASIHWDWKSRGWKQGLLWTRNALSPLLARGKRRFETSPTWVGLTPWTKTTGARLEGCAFSGDLSAIRLRNARLDNSILQGAGLRRADLSSCSLRGANLHQADLRRVCFERADLSEALVDEADLEFSSLSNAVLRRASFISANLQESNLTRADCERAHFFLCNLAQCSASQSNLTRASFLYAQLRKADLSSAYLYETELHFADLKEANLQCADLSRANLLSAELQDADLRDANLMLANLYDADLRWANLGNITWAGACLLSANLQNAKASDAFLSYAFTQAALLNESQIERIIDWNEEHPDAPWLHDDWEFWWERIEVDDELDWKSKGFRFDDYAFEIHEEIDAIQSYLKTIWKGLD